METGTVYDWGAEGDGVAADSRPDEKGYNGWANYETWSVALIVDNDEGLYHERRQLVAGARGDAILERPDYLTEAEAVRYGVAEAVKEWVCDQAPTAGEGLDTGPMAYLWDQLLGAALSEVDWSEIADAWLEE